MQNKLLTFPQWEGFFFAKVLLAGEMLKTVSMHVLLAGEMLKTAKAIFNISPVGGLFF